MSDDLPSVRRAGNGGVLHDVLDLGTALGTGMRDSGKPAFVASKLCLAKHGSSGGSRGYSIACSISQLLLGSGIRASRGGLPCMFEVWCVRRHGLRSWSLSRQQSRRSRSLNHRRQYPKSPKHCPVRVIRHHQGDPRPRAGQHPGGCPKSLKRAGGCGKAHCERHVARPGFASLRRRSYSAAINPSAASRAAVACRRRRRFGSTGTSI